MILMIVISLMTLSFATLSRREQRQALDKQLSTQAFYAAESGINDALNAISSNALLGDITDCSDAEQDKLGSEAVGELNIETEVSRTCVLIDQSPSQIDDIVGENSATIFPITATNIDSLDIYWENDSAVSVPEFPSSIDPAGAFPPDSDWDGDTPGVLVIQLIPANFPTSRAAIASGTKYLFAYPSQDNSPQEATSGTVNGTILRGDCSASNLPRQCRVTISDLGGLSYYIHLRAIYDPVRVTLEAKDSGGAQLSFIGAQMIIDSTGRASDITKRIKIYKPINSSSVLPSAILKVGDDLCKRLLSNPNSTTTDSAIPSCLPTYP